MKGAEGAEKIAELMDKLRNETPKKFGSWDVLEARDYKKDECVDLKTGEKKSTDFRHPMYYIMHFLTMHGAVQDRPEQNQRLSSTWALRAAT